MKEWHPMDWMVQQVEIATGSRWQTDDVRLREVSLERVTVGSGN